MKPEILYHGSPAMFDTLQLDNREQTKNGETRPWAFATHLRNHALPYTISQRWSFMSTQETDAGRSLTLVAANDRDRLWQPVDGYLHRIPAQTFSRVIVGGEPTNEWASPSAVPFDRASSERVTSIEQILAEGIQLFSSSTPMDNMAFQETFEDAGNHAEIMRKTAEGLLVWENMRLSINPAPELLKFLAGSRSRLPTLNGPNPS